jgi:hypothetical protein
MNLTDYTQKAFQYHEIDFVIKAFRDNENFGFVIKALFANGKRANNFTYRVNYETNRELLNSTGDNAVGHLMQRAEEDIRMGYYFGSQV